VITGAGNISGSLDLARADPTATIKSQCRIRQWAGGGAFYIYTACDIEIADITSAITYQGWIRGDGFNDSNERFAIWGGAI